MNMNERDSTFSQIWNRAPDSKTGRPREMGTDLARKIEDVFGLPTGWMDTPLGGGVSEPQVAYVAGGWPFRFDRRRFDNLSIEDRARVEGAALATVIECERGCVAKQGRSKTTKRSA